MLAGAQLSLQSFRVAVPLLLKAKNIHSVLYPILRLTAKLYLPPTLALHGNRHKSALAKQD
jgi:hypothetical protein